jgi:hypothetical protein
MTERRRENGYQWVDGEVFVVWDQFHDAPDRPGAKIFNTEKDALDYAVRKGWEERTVILRVPAILAHKLTS